MAYLLNRNPAARIECLHALVEFIYNKFGENTDFTLTSVKFNRDERNIHEFCSMLIDSSLGTKYCPYKQNPLDEAGCSLTNGVDEDSTKSKEVSNTINALHALGFVNRNDRKIRITPFGIRFAKAKYGSEEMQEIIKEAVLHYVPAVGVLKQIIDVADGEGNFDSTGIRVGYPNTFESVVYENHNVLLSTGSKSDSNTRTRSFILAWLTTAGFIRPQDLKDVPRGEYAHTYYGDYINQSHRGKKLYKLIEKPDFAGFITQRPLGYYNLTKSTPSLREKGQKIQREATMLYEDKIKNRRFAILYILNEVHKTRENVLFGSLLTFFQNHPDLFVITDKNLSAVIQSELEIANIAGIPYDIVCVDDKIYIKPLTGLNMEELAKDAPAEIIDILKQSTI